jgi:hypothetical protein
MSYTVLTTLAREKSIASSFISYLAFIWDVIVTHRACIHISNSHVVIGSENVFMGKQRKIL